VLDCCYSGKAWDTVKKVPGKNISVLTATLPNDKAKAPPDKPLTAFTECLIKLLEKGFGNEPTLTTTEIRKVLRERLPSEGSPKAWGEDFLDDDKPLRIAYNRAYSDNLEGTETPSINNPIYHIWDRLEPDLQDALAVAYNEARRNHQSIISTRRFFAALARLQPELLKTLKIPKESLPDPITEPYTRKDFLLSEDYRLSSCVEDSFRALVPKTTSQRKLSSVDVFIDLAKHGHGNSVAQLREHGITSEKVNQTVKELNLNPIERYIEIGYVEGDIVS
jgi:hypothetical protein